MAAGLAIPAILGAATKILPGIFGKKKKSSDQQLWRWQTTKTTTILSSTTTILSSRTAILSTTTTLFSTATTSTILPTTSTNTDKTDIAKKNKKEDVLANEQNDVSQSTHTMKRAHEPEDEPIEVHDSGFMSPMVMFPTFPHNDTFVDSRKIKLIAGPVANPDAEEYTFVHAPNNYGVMDLQNAKIKATIALTAADNC
ncbi:Hypothetical predicted protein [Paramuricea clavata]|uniref:Uncharacterized protein n=1 Tax=Paramuricea clavata TaxID=317549 RepID=A0A6S7GEK8_PARCT|nr:Hypothetical predicted protein [Paramuricea clavata]